MPETVPCRPGSPEFKAKHPKPTVNPRQTNKPSDYALGSLESRIAARVMLERIEAERKKDLNLVKIEFIGFGVGDRTFEVYVPKKGGSR